MIFKNPKTDSAHFKKSHRGCCSVHFDGTDFSCKDGLTWKEHDSDLKNVLLTVFKDGKMVQEYTLKQIRDLLHWGNF